MRIARTTSRRLAKLGAISIVCLVGENSDVLRPGIVGMRGSMPIYTTTAMHDMSSPPPTPTTYRIVVARREYTPPL